MPPTESKSPSAGRAFDAIVVGAGIAGLTFALRLPPNWNVAILTKGVLGESNTRYAQGGISAAIGPDDSPALHETDTIDAGAGLCDASAVHALVEGAPDAIDWLVSIGTAFDRDELTGALQLGREAAHSRFRVLHAGGDATGAEVERSLVAAVRARESIAIHEHAFAIELQVADGRCAGVWCLLEGRSGPELFSAPVVVLAAGGAGQLWAVTSNPRGATADGLAIGLRAGVAVADLEFVQFHPTVLALPDGEPFLITEAVRGEGAWLRDRDGTRFMVDRHPLAELAPRDIVARGIQSAMADTGEDRVYLDLRRLDSAAMHARFPTISRELAGRGLDLTRDLIPVAPAAHYFIGGIAAGTDGRTSMPGLFALGEAACTGVHGANRLASNSLLEGLVFGMSAATAVTRREQPLSPASASTSPTAGPPVMTGEASLHSQPADALVAALRETMSRDVAVVRDRPGLLEARASVDGILEEVERIEPASLADWEARNMALAARAIVAAALAREESRGAHYRSDFPDRDLALDGMHSLLPIPDLDAWQTGPLENVIGQANRQSVRDVASRS
jgi:L-aspartate oxidase